MAKGVQAGSHFGLVGLSLLHGADCLIVNKFGKHEAEGRGFRQVIAQALELGIPLLVGITALNRQAFLGVTGGMAIEITPDKTALARWGERRSKPPSEMTAQACGSETSWVHETEPAPRSRLCY